MPSEYESACDLLCITDELSYKTRGCSMRPLFREHRDIINIRRPVEPLKRGDVVLYPDKGGCFLILHRIISVKGDNLLIRGDNNYNFNEHRTADEVVGVMTSFFREGKYCDVKKSKRYKLYTFWILHSYPLRWLWKCAVRPTLGKIKRLIFKPKNPD